MTCKQTDPGPTAVGGKYQDLLIAEINWMAVNAPHLNFDAAIDHASIQADVCAVLVRCQKKAAGGAS